MKAAAGANGGVCISCCTMCIGFGFNNPNFSDRVLKLQLTQDSQNTKGSSSTSPPSSCVMTLHINSLVLGSQSPFFYKMFSNGMEESEQQAVTIQLKASEGVAMLDLLEFLYNHKLKADTPLKLLKVLVLADRYQVAACVTFCAQRLSSLPMTFELASSCLNLPSTITEGGDTHLTSLMDEVKIFISKNFSKHYEQALDLPLESVEKIMSWDTLEVDSEVDVCNFLLNWTTAHYNDINERCHVFSSRLFQLVRLPYMSCEELKILLHFMELKMGGVTKKVIDALLFKLEKNLTLADVEDPTFRGRVYKLRPVEVVALDRPNQEYIIYSKLKKEDCRSIEKSSVGIHTQMFYVGNEPFYLEYDIRHIRPENESHERLLGITVRRCMISKSTIDALSVDLEVAVILKTSGKFTVQWTESCNMKRGGGLWFPIGKSWDLLMMDDSEYFDDNDVLNSRVSFTLKE